MRTQCVKLSEFRVQPCVSHKNMKAAMQTASAVNALTDLH